MNVPYTESVSVAVLKRPWNSAVHRKPALIGPRESPFVTELWYAVVPGYASQSSAASRRVCESLGAAIEVWVDQEGASPGALRWTF